MLWKQKFLNIWTAYKILKSIKYNITYQALSKSKHNDSM